MDERLLYFIWLSNTFRAGSAAPKKLLCHFDSIFDIYKAGYDDYKELDLSESDIKALCNKDLAAASSHLAFCKSENVGIFCYDDPLFPERLKIINNPPAMFYYKGRLNMLDDYPCITMVGTRSCSERGFRLAYEVGFDAASKGAVIVNGLALGIDGACIAGGLDANGYFVGVLGCGIDRVYPAGNTELFKRLCATGLILSEFPPFTAPEGRNFPVRNRVISALSIATCIFEAEASKSGAMITAEHALNQGRRIFAVPGKPYDKSYSGPLELIKNGASVFTAADDILSEYSMAFPHRINLANKNTPPSDKLDRLINMYFKKGTDPDEPVNRRFVKSFDKSGKAAKSEKPSDSSPSKSALNTKSKEKQVSGVKEVSGVKAVSEEKQSYAVSEKPKQTKAGTAVENKPESTAVEPDLSVLSVTEKQVFELLQSKGTLTADEISQFGIKIEQVLSVLTLLEIYGLVTALPGGRYKTYLQ